MSLERLMASEELAGAPIERWQRALEQHLGASVRWRLLSWGGELSSVGYRTPTGGPRGAERVRFVSLELGPGATLVEVGEHGHPVVACLARGLDGGGRPRFARDGPGPEPEVPDGVGEVTITGRLWGVVSESGWTTLWLRSCEVLAAPATGP